MFSIWYNLVYLDGQAHAWLAAFTNSLVKALQSKNAPRRGPSLTLEQIGELAVFRVIARDNLTEFGRRRRRDFRAVAL